ncbi:MAG: OmpA family protein [Blautia sp.]|nr:OmpA family protein [Blautia sp.]
MSRRKKTEDSGFNVWRSYSDMMGGVLLLFVLIMCVTLFQAQKSYNESIKERDEKISLQEQYTAELLAKQRALEEKEGELTQTNAELKDKNVLLSEQQAKIDEQQAKLDELAAQLAQQKATLDAQQIKLGEQETALNEKTTQLANQQKKIDNIIGVKAEVVESLKDEFARNNINVDIDAQTGALTLKANVMFGKDDSELTEEGEEALRSVLPIYCRVLLQEDYKPYLGEILIDGYTDTDGDYGYNLQLSQMRSLAVAEYLLEIQDEFLSDREKTDLQSFLTVNGHSMANPVLDAFGNVDMDASRRVEVKFRLKDDEMIQELNRILTTEELAAAPGN